jgi:hypothetical protein
VFTFVPVKSQFTQAWDLTAERGEWSANSPAGAAAPIWSWIAASKPEPPQKGEASYSIR